MFITALVAIAGENPIAEQADNPRDEL